LDAVGLNYFFSLSMKGVGCWIGIAPSTIGQLAVKYQ
jgi:hypothetical protein